MNKPLLSELIIDIGNTSIAFALFKDNQVNLFIKIKTNLMLRYDETYSFFEENFDFNVNQVFISSVVPVLNGIFENVIFSFFKIKPLFISFDLNYDLTFNPYKNGKFLLGSDVFANLVAAIENYSFENVLVVDLGTACTIFAVSRQDGILGGLINSGPLINFNSLIDNAYLLKKFPISTPNSLLERTTSGSINSGLFYQYKYLIEGVYCDIKKMYKKEFNLIIAGGNANLILPLIEIEFIFNIHLTVEGIRILGNSIDFKFVN
ncbi:type III pantothenate kinase [Borreliella californiensis]|uniref:Type III pantothenate kinase n=1 Tax=Borreliella californiensis TaxID=373543 RepID=A0A7X0DNY9_9SPIR|nr:type III pantothenate kinase [Borreliella californiensis]MBB6212643.1 type III pantothenate kinase [Borreliella californiensis]WKC91798.1 type III pantothenate kinase [Borreliella californiensis]WNY70550.1 type III pantothenate kinase [Borreliella californiensis]